MSASQPATPGSTPMTDDLLLARMVEELTATGVAWDEAWRVARMVLPTVRALYPQGTGWEQS